MSFVSLPQPLPAAKLARKPPFTASLRRQYKNIYGSCSGCGGVFRCSSISAPTEDGFIVVEDDLHALLQILPRDLQERLQNEPRRHRLLEVIMDLGRQPEARFLGESGGQYLRNTEISLEELEEAQKNVGDFAGDNRAGIEGTLHRISAIKSRKGVVVGLTCRIGRAVTGHVDMVRDLLQCTESILFLGRPGVGKTTVMREIARVLADELHKRV